MANIKDLDIFGSPIKLLLIAENGMGKSVAAASFPGPINFHDFDGRMKPVASYYPGADINYKTFSAENFRYYFDELEALQVKCPWKTLITDSVTSASTSCVLYQLKQSGNMKVGQSGLPKTTWDEINHETVWFTQMLEASCKIIYEKFGTNIIWNAHPVPRTQIVDGNATRTTSIMAYGNKVPGLVPGYFDEIYSIQMKKVGLDKYERRVYTVPMNELPGKTSFKLPESFDITGKNFYEELMKHVKNGK